VPSDFHRLRVLRLAAQLSDEVYAAVERWPMLAKVSFGSAERTEEIARLLNGLIKRPV
jgi:hypothetical protein